MLPVLSGAEEQWEKREFQNVNSMKASGGGGGGAETHIKAAHSKQMTFTQIIYFLGGGYGLIESQDRNAEAGLGWWEWPERDRLDRHR